MSTIAPPGGGDGDPGYPVIVVDADERPVAISPGLRSALGLRPDAPPPGNLRAIMDEASAWRVHAALRYGRGALRDSLALRLTVTGAGSRAASAEVLPTTGGGAVLVVSLAPGRWSGDDAARLLEHSHDLAFSVRVHPAFSFRYVNPAAAQVTGYGPEDLEADPSLFLESVHPEDRVSFIAALVDAPGLEAPVLFRFRHRDSGWRWFELSSAPVADDAGRPAIIDGIIRDVTVRHRLEEQFRLLAERSPEMVYRFRIVPGWATDYVSPSCLTVTGHRPEEFHSDPGLLLGYVHPDDRHILQEYIEHPGDSCDRPLRLRIFHPDGSLHWIEQVNVPVVDEAGRLVAVEGVCRDITERQEVEAALQGMNRRMNLLASLTRHDILNQLTVLLGSLELAGTAENKTELAWFLNRSREAGWAIHRLTEFTRDYQEIGQGRPAWISVTTLARRAAASFAGEPVTVEIPDERWEILADPLIEQVFYNLIENALRHGGSVGRIRFSVQAEPAGGVVIACEDDGAGIPVNEKERIFERGYGRNTGLGLYLSSEILGTTGMSIAETGRSGLGARFEIRVPPGACKYARVADGEELLLHQR